MVFDKISSFTARSLLAISLKRKQVLTVNLPNHANIQVVNTLLPTPTAPRINGVSANANGTGVWDTRVRLRWDGARENALKRPIGGGGRGGGRAVAPGGGGVGGAVATEILKQVCDYLEPRERRWAG